MQTEPNENDTAIEGLPAGALTMAAKILGCESMELEASQVSGDASSRCYFRFRKGQGGGTVIAAVYPEPFDETESAVASLINLEAVNPLARLSFANDPCSHLEATDLFARAGLPVPSVLDVSGAERTILLEDVGDARLQDWLPLRFPADQQQAYRTAVDYIVRLQELTPSVSSPETLYTRLAFDEAKLKFELDFFAENFFNRYLSAPLDAEGLNEMNDAFTGICRQLAALPRVLTHRDYHARNLMMDGERIVIIDHQDARLGPEAYDLVSLLDDPYAELADEQSAAMIDYFVERKGSSSLPLVRPNEFQQSIRLAAVQRMLKAVGTYTFQAAVRYNEVYIQYIEPALGSALKHLNALGTFPELECILDEAIELAVE